MKHERCARAEESGFGIEVPGEGHVGRLPAWTEHQEDAFSHRAASALAKQAAASTGERRRAGDQLLSPRSHQRRT